MKKDYVEISNKEYHQRGEIGSSSIKEILENIRRWRYKKEWKSSSAMNIGSYAHSLCLEPENTDKDFIVTDVKVSKSIKKLSKMRGLLKTYPEEYLTPSGALSKSQSVLEKMKDLEEGKVYITPLENEQIRFYLSNLDKQIISKKEAEIAQAAAKKVNDLYSMQLAFNLNEKSFFGKIGGVNAKIRPDSFEILDEERKIIGIWDLKFTGQEVTEKNFTKFVSDFNVHIQQAWYTLVLESLGYTVEFFHFLVASTLEHSGVELFKIPDDLVEAGKEACFIAIRKLLYCQQNDVWKEGRFVDGEGFKDVTEIDVYLNMYDRFNK